MSDNIVDDVVDGKDENCQKRKEQGRFADVTDHLKMYLILHHHLQLFLPLL